MTRHYIIAGIVAALCSAVAYRIGYNDGRRPFKLDVQHYSSGKIIVYPTPTPVPCAPDYVWVPGTGLTTPTPMVNYNGTQVYCDGTVILVTTPQRVGVFDPATGRVKWRVPTPTPAPVVSGAPCYEPMQKDRQFMFRPVACPDFGAKP